MKKKIQDHDFILFFGKIYIHVKKIHKREKKKNWL